MSSIKKVLVATDLTEDGDTAVAVARSWAERLGATLVVAHVIPEQSRSDMLFPQQHVAEANSTVTMHRAIAHRLESRLGPSDEPAILEGPAGETLLAAAKERAIDLIVLGGREPSGKRVFGSVAEYVLTHSTVPVLIARQHARTARVVAAVDVEDAPHAAVDYALGLAEPPLNAQIVVVHCLTDREPIDAESSLVLKQVRRRLPRSGEIRLERGEPAAAIVAVAERTEAELIVVGTHGRKGLARFVVGSVASAVARRASCSVLVVPLQAVER
jgi:nucleotide-binding universal stress UspA family protein